MKIICVDSPQTKGREETGRGERGEFWPQSEMIQIIIEENSSLKLELERCCKKVFKSQKLEQEIGKIHHAHQELVARCERREQLESTVKAKLQSDCRRLVELNRSLKDRLDLLSMHTDNPATIEYMRKELTHRDLLIGRFHSESMIIIYFSDSHTFNFYFSSQSTNTIYCLCVYL